MSAFLRTVVVLTVLAVIFGGLFTWRFQQIDRQRELMSQAPPPAAVEAVEVTSRRWQESITAIGALRAINGVELANEVAGVVEAVDFESGEQVEAGQVLIRLNAEIDQAVLETRRVEARLALQRLERLSDLIEQQAVSESEFDDARLDYEATVARVREQQALLDKKTIRAPFSGVLGLRQVDLGEYLAEGTAFVGINMLDPIQVDFTLPERSLSQVSPGDAVEVQVAAFPGESFSGKVLALDSSVVPESRTVRVRAQMDNPELRLRPGMFARVRTWRDVYREVLTVPRTAISYNTYGDFVFAVVADDKGQTVVERVTVKTGEVRAGEVEVTEGIGAQARVVKAGLLRLRNGQPVEVVNKSGRPSEQR
ncbi:MAG: efflux RND transporter periplasmic adaptor subunit [Xanthomonadales bacterium]|nr:efflux RND transporter periplasmic adaptor subunit [Xanthomonadales bacterium]